MSLLRFEEQESGKSLTEVCRQSWTWRAVAAYSGGDAVSMASLMA